MTRHRKLIKIFAPVALLPLYGAQNEVYNDDWVKSGLIVLCFS